MGMRKQFVLVAAFGAAAMLGACKSSDVDTVVGDRPNDVKRGFHAVGSERWRVVRVAEDGGVQLERADFDNEVQRVKGDDKRSLTLGAEELERLGGLGLKSATLHEDDELLILRNAQGQIETVELETTRDANGGKRPEKIEQPGTVFDEREPRP